MFNNYGYINCTRSVRSDEAIDSGEMPLSLINKSVLIDFINENESFSENEKEILKEIKINFFKFCAKKHGATSWHHTGSKYRKTDHFDIETIAFFILENLENLKDDFKNFQENLKKEKKEIDYKFGVANVAIWGGTRRRPRIIGNETLKGVIVGEWLHHSSGKINIFAKKTNWFKRFETYKELVKNFKEFKNSKKEFNQILKKIKK